MMTKFGTDSYCEERPIEAGGEVGELVGQCLWDVFSDSHEVVGQDGRVLDLGLFRGSGGFLADVLNRQSETRQYEYVNEAVDAALKQAPPTTVRAYEAVYGCFPRGWPPVA